MGFQYFYCKVVQQQNNDSLINESYIINKEEITSHLNHELKPVVSATTCENYDLIKVKNILNENQYDNEEVVHNEAVHFKYDTVSGNGKADIFILRSGTIVSWDVLESEVIEKLIPIFKDAMITTYPIQTEDLDYIDMGDNETNKGSSFIDGEIICIKGEESQKLLDKVAFSYGISRSTRLAILESSLERHIQLTKDTTENLSQGKELKISAKEVLKSSGRLMLLRGKLNLYSELIETPDLCWSEPNLEIIYNDISKILDVNTRISILNRKLDYSSDEARALLDLLNSQKGTRLEWIIIYLIMIEVCFEVYHFYERFIEKQETKELV
ncbi:hypothetical protein CANARDRAFT_207984 [[Candida] arabinofermentans NRRL YB-2248]|uniref:DUF155 domain-containing protein n=1 Tax=[Candida] arabinofermentans NRRL YB-2248 TaxID=983967 RepID=A0A1E4T037_9ASCO|nr:hypothetical protein CANARDRAFT_207984 [[Candida] arabinofermentans NRRL YB-2248]